MQETLQILLIEDSKIDAQIILDELQHLSRKPLLTRIASRSALENALQQEKWDLVLCDFVLPGFGAWEALDILNRTNPDIPVIVVSGSAEEEIIIQTLKKGADNYVMKNNLIRLVPVIERELEAAAARREGLRESLRLEEVLRQKEIDERFRLMAEDAPLMLWITDEAGFNIYSNQAWLEATGHTADESLGVGWVNAIPAEDRETEKQKFMTAFHARSAYESEFRIRGPQGKVRWLVAKGAPMYSAKNEFLGYVGTCLDLTERKQVELALEESERRFRLLVDSAKEYAIFMLDPQGHVLTWNQGAEAIYGYSAETILGQHVSQFYTEADVWLGKPNYEMNLALTEPQFEEEVWQIRQNSSPFWALSNTSVIRGEDGAVLGFTKIIRDLSERLNMEEQVQLSKEKAAIAELMNQKKNLYFSVITHELKTPLNAIIGFTDMLKGEYSGPLNDKQKRYVDNVAISGNHSLTMVNDILDLAKLEASRLVIHPEPTDINVLVQEVQSIAAQLSKGKKVHLDFDVSEEITSVEADPLRLRQILYNILSNAIKFNSQEGSVHVRFYPSQNRQQMICRITDTGIGIPKEKQRELFTEFYQVDSTASRNQEGTGLGLALTKKLVELHGGNISLESEVGQGTTVTFSLPIRSCVRQNGLESVALR